MAIKLYRDKGVRTHVLAKTLGVSSATVWKWCVRANGFHKLGYHSQGNKKKSYSWKLGLQYVEPRLRSPLKKMKITSQSEYIRSYFQLLVRWMNSAEPLNLDKIVAGEEPP